MTPTVSVVFFSGGEPSSLERQLPLVQSELLSVGGGACLVVDPTQGELEVWLAEHQPEVTLIRSGEAAVDPSAVLLEAAGRLTSDLVLVLGEGVQPRPGFLAALISAMEDRAVGLVGARVDGAPPRALVLEDGRLHPLDREPRTPGGRPYPVPFPADEAYLVRRSLLLERGGFDPLIAPGPPSRVDLGLRVWRGGGTVLEVPEAVVERVRPSLELPEHLSRAAEEKNRLLLYWKYLDTSRDAHHHLATLWRDALEAAISGQREELVWLALALQELAAVGRSRQALPEPRRALGQVLLMSDPRS